MKIVSSGDSEFVPASHEEAEAPGVLKKILLRKNDFIDGKVQMLNWALLPVGRSFSPHYHQDMQEVFIMIEGRAIMTVDGQEAAIGPGDVVVIAPKGVHRMENTGSEDVQYLVVGISGGKKGKTVVV